METATQVRNAIMEIAAELDARAVSGKRAQEYRQRLHDAAAALERGIVKAEGADQDGVERPLRALISATSPSRS